VINLAVNQAATQKVSMQVGRVAENVVVSANVELVTTGTATVGQLIDQKQVVDLPLNGRHAQTLLYLAAGTVDEANPQPGIWRRISGRATCHINGTGLGQVNYQLDGAGHNDTYLNLNLPFPNPDCLQEFQPPIGQSQYTVGNAAGGVVNIVTKSGTNQIHGTLFEFLRNGSFECAKLFRARARQSEAEPVWRVRGGPILKRQAVLLRYFPGNAHPHGARGPNCFRPYGGPTAGRFFEPSQPSWWTR